MKRGFGVSNRTLITMHPLDVYYLNQTVSGTNPEIGPVYSAPTSLQRGHGIDNFSAISFAVYGLSCGEGPRLWAAGHCLLVAKS